MNHHHSLSSLAVIASIALVVAGCGGGSGSHSSAKSSGSPTQTAVAASAVKISNFKFSPASVTVKPGVRLTVSNEDSATHTVTADDGHSFDTGDVAQGQSHTISVTKPGTYAYHCSIHPYMHGTLVVK
jgi:plastocyanin